MNSRRIATVVLLCALMCLPTAAAQAQIASSGWRVLYTDSQATDCGNYGASNAFDGNAATMWITEWCHGAPPTPHEIQIDLGAYYTINGFQYLPRQDQYSTGNIADYEFYVSTDGVNWGPAVSTGTLMSSASDNTQKQVDFTGKAGRYVRLRALTEVNGGPWTNVAELNVLGSAVATSGPEVGSLTLSPASIAGGGTTSTATVTLTSAPLTNATVTLASSNTAATVPTTVTVNAGTTSANFIVTSAPSVSTSTLSVINAAYNGSTGAAVLTVTPGNLSATAIPRSGWSVLYVDSQATDCGNYGASNAFDGNPGTMWITEWCHGVPPTPHEIQIDLGATYTISGFQYLPRQDNYSSGNIANYEFYVSADGVNWGNPVANGKLMPNSQDKTQKLVTFTEVVGRYVRLRALSEVSGGPWTNAAEINVLGAVFIPTIPNAGWQLLYADSQATDCGNYGATNAFDGNPATMWITEWCHGAPTTPHEIQIDLGATYTISGFQYLPRQDQYPSGNVASYEFYVSADGANWGTAVSSGTLITNSSDHSQKQVTFAGVNGRYVRFRGLSEVNGGPWTAVAELNVLGSVVATIAPAVPVITSATTANGIVGAAFAYQITATNSPTGYGAAGLPAGLGVNTATGLISGTPTSAGTSTVTLSASNGGGTGNATLTMTTTSDTTPPTVPTGLSANPISSSQINLSWVASTDPDNASGQLSYGVYRNGIQIATTTAGTTAWNDTGLAASTTYTYAVSAQDPAGNSSAQSASAQATTPGSTRPYVTTFPLAENPISEGGNWINGSSASTSWADVVTTTNFAFGNPTVGAYGDPTALVTGSWGAEQTVQATVRIPSSPAAGFAEVELRLRSTISANSITGYEVLCSVKPGNGYIQIVKWMGPVGSFNYVQALGKPPCVNGDVLKATITTSGGSAVINVYVNNTLVETGTDTNVGGTGPYTSGAPGIGFYIAGGSDVSDFGFSSFTATDGLTADITPPSTPTNLSAAAISPSQINLSWTASTDNVAVSGYQVFRGNIQIATTTTTSFSDVGLSASTQYAYAVAAFDEAGNTSSQTAPVVITTPAPDITPPSVPVILQSSNITSSSLTITWSTSADDVAVAGYQIFRNGNQVATATATSYADSGLAPQTTYAYTVAAFDYSNNVSAQSQQYLVTTTAGSLTPPSLVQVNQNQVASGTGVSVVLNSVTSAGNTIVAYVIWDNTGSVSLADSLGDQFVSVSAPITWSGRYSAQVFYATNIVGGADTVTAAFRNSVNSFGVIYAHEYAWISAVNPVDVTVAASGSSALLSSGNATTTSANDLIFGAGVSDNMVTAAGSSFTARDLAYGNITEDRIASSTGSYSATATHNGSSWAIQMVAFRAAQ